MVIKVRNHLVNHTHLLRTHYMLSLGLPGSTHGLLYTYDSENTRGEFLICVCVVVDPLDLLSSMNQTEILRKSSKF